MVVDFKEIGWLKDFIDDIVDHKFIIARHDPMFDQLVTGVYEVACGVEPKFEPIFVDMCKVVGHSVNMDHVPADTSEYETLEGFTIVDFVPTSENLAKWIYDIVAAKMSQFNHVKVTCIEWSETPKSIARYYG
jgi:6-pyruvoyltetrahydropterin/6-carboxytetrahydropterin synthase